MAPPAQKWFLLRKKDRLRLNDFSDFFITATCDDTQEVAFIYFQDITSIKQHIAALQKKESFKKISYTVVCDKFQEEEVSSIMTLLEVPFSVRTYQNGKKIHLAMDGETKKIRAQGLIKSTPTLSKNEKIRVMIVDDSSTVRKVLKRAVDKMSNTEVVAEVGDPRQAEALIEQHRPDVMTLDIQMPGLTGPELLKSLKAKNRIPAVVVTSMNMDEGNDVLDALENGAVDYLKKPSLNELNSIVTSLEEKLIIAAQQQAKNSKESTRPSRPQFRGEMDTSRFLAIGSSTGGPDALANFLPLLPAHIPPTLIVQHIPQFFSKALAERLDKNCKFRVKEAEDGDEMKPGIAYIAPGGMQSKITVKGSAIYINVNDDAPISNHKPSVDYMMASVATHMKERALGIVLTGMGNDGAKGLLQIRKAGGNTLTQSEDSCVVYGMPKTADEAGASEESVHIENMAHRTCEILAKTSQKKTPAA